MCINEIANLSAQSPLTTKHGIKYSHIELSLCNRTQWQMRKICWSQFQPHFVNEEVCISNNTCIYSKVLLGDNKVQVFAWCRLAHWYRDKMAKSAPSHYLNQCWNSVKSTLRNKLQWNFNRNSYVFIKENAFENVVWKMAAILSRPQCVKVSFRCQAIAWTNVDLLSISPRWLKLSISKTNRISTYENAPKTSANV